jgi:hypothetical protein
MTSRRVLTAMITTAGLAVFSHASQADMGKAPVGPGGSYVSIEGGYLYQDGPEVNGHGIVATAGGPEQDVKVSPDDGFFAGGLVGYETGTPFLAGFHRVELFLQFGRATDGESDTSPPASDLSLKTVDGVTLVTGGFSAKTRSARQSWEFGTRLERDAVYDPATTVTWSLAPFVRSLEEDTRSVVSACCDIRRSGKIDAWLYGLSLSAEPETWVTPQLALVGRLGAGVYGYDADGKFRSLSDMTPDGFAASVSDGDSGVGFRGLLGVGLKYKLSPASTLEGFAEADYFSKVPTAHLSSNSSAGGYESHVQDDDLWELRTGLRLTIGLGPTPN